MMTDGRDIGLTGFGHSRRGGRLRCSKVDTRVAVWTLHADSPAEEKELEYEAQTRTEEEGQVTF